MTPRPDCSAPSWACDRGIPATEFGSDELLQEAAEEDANLLRALTRERELPETRNIPERRVRRRTVEKVSRADAIAYCMARIPNHQTRRRVLSNLRDQMAEDAVRLICSRANSEERA